jgi:hypothetical protein
MMARRPFEIPPTHDEAHWNDGGRASFVGVRAEARSELTCSCRVRLVAWSDAALSRSV